MLTAERGSTRMTILIIVAVLIVVAGMVYLLSRSRDADSQIIRTYHCNACGKDFEVDLNALGAGKPTCRYCSSPDVVMVQTKD